MIFLLILNSDIRSVPDNQEVFVDVNTDQSIIIEILQLVHQATNEDAARCECITVMI